MLKVKKLKKLKNSTILFIGIILVSLGVIVGSFEYFQTKKNKAFSKMNIMLYESEMPEMIYDVDTPGSEAQNPSKEIIQEDPKEDSKEDSSSENTKKVYNMYIGTLEIPKINLRRGFLDITSPYNNIDYNVTIINGSTYPDVEKGNFILAAHSGYCYYCYFSELYKLELGDEAYVSYKGIKYKYKLVKIYEVEKTGKVTIYRNYNKTVLTLITCTRNSNTKQTVYILELEE